MTGVQTCALPIYVDSANFATNSTYSDTASYVDTASFATNATYADTATYVDSAAYADTADFATISMDDLLDADTAGVQTGQVLKWDGTNWVPTDTVTFANYSDTANYVDTATFATNATYAGTAS